MTAIIASKGYETPLIYDTTPGTEIACAGANAYTAAQGGGGGPVPAGIISLRLARRLTIWGHVDAGAAGSIVSLVFGVSAAENPPSLDPTVGRWYPATKLDDLSVNATLAAAPGIGSPAWTAQPAWSTNTMRPLDCRTPAAVAAGDEVPFKIVLDVSDALWCLVKYGQVDADAAAKILAYYSLSSG